LKGLLWKEWTLYKSWLFGSAVMGIGVVLILPIILERYLLTTVSIQDLRVGLMSIMLGFSVLNIIIQFNTSLNSDNGKKDMWLHSPHSMHTLIGAKFIFSLVIYFVGNILITTCGIYFLKDVFLGSFVQLFNFQLLLLAIMLLAGVFCSITWLFFWTMYFEGKYWIGKFSVIITVVIFFLLASYLPKLLTFLSLDKLLKQGEISLEFLRDHFPRITTTNFTVDLGSIYIVEELFTWIIFILFFWFVCKWLERVVTR